MPDITPKDILDEIEGIDESAVTSDHLHRWWTALGRARDRIAELEQQVSHLCDDASELDHDIRESAKRVLTADQVDGNRECVPPLQEVVELLVGQVAALRADAGRWGYMRTSGVVLVIHDLPYRGSDLDAAVDTEIVKLRERANGDGVR